MLELPNAFKEVSIKKLDEAIPMLLTHYGFTDDTIMKILESRPIEHMQDVLNTAFGVSIQPQEDIPGMASIQKPNLARIIFQKYPKMISIENVVRLKNTEINEVYNELKELKGAASELFSKRASDTKTTAQLLRVKTKIPTPVRVDMLRLHAPKSINDMLDNADRSPTLSYVLINGAQCLI